MRIGIDGMGGDFAPENVVMGVIQASTAEETVYKMTREKKYIYTLS